MPLPKPHAGESQSDFISRCMSEAFGSDAPADRTQDQAVAMCHQAWRDEHGGEKPKAAAEVARVIARWGALFGGKRTEKLVRDLSDLPAPEPGESESEFMDRCIQEMADAGLTDEGDAEDACRVSWEEQGGEESADGLLMHKSHTTEGGGLEFILSDATPDRFGDVIEVEGWEFNSFLKNPLALFNHNPNFPIGTWKNVRKETDSLRGHLVLAPKGTSDRIDEIRRLVEAGILRAVSVGFKAIKSAPLKPFKEGDDPLESMFGPRRFTRQELVETSLVSIPANPNALAVVKSLNISQETQRLVFGKHANRERERARLISMSSGKHATKSDDNSNGKHATSSTAKGKGNAMSGLSARIQEVQKRLVLHTDELGEHLTKLDDSNVSDEQMQKTTDINAKIAQDRKTLAMLEESERNLAGIVANKGTSLEVVRHHDGNGRDIDDKERARRDSYFAPRGSKELKPLDYVVRTGVVTYLARIFNRSPEDICKGYEPYNDEKTRTIVDWNIKTAVNPAMTTVAGWAAELVVQINADYLGLLQPQSVLPRLSAKGLNLTFGRAGRINIPMRSATPTIAGSFVGEGMPIPVRRGAFTSQVLTPKKLAVISTWTKEIDMHSIPAIEGLIREAIADDTAVAVDSILLDNNAATTIRPAGLLNGATSVGPTALGGNAFNAIVSDIKLLVGALVTSTKGNIRSPVFLMNPADVLGASLIVPPNTGVMPFRDELAAGRLVNIPVIDSGTVPVHTVVLVDAADFVIVGGEAPAFDISDQATIHEEDTSPAAIVGGTSPGTAATPVRSLWQTDTLALRMIQRLNWTLRRTGMVAYVTGVTWA